MVDKQKSGSGELVPSGEAARVLGVSTERVRQLARQGRLVPARVRRSPAGKTLRSYWLRDVQALRDQARAVAALREARDTATQEYLDALVAARRSK